jgi:hypothetical protein
MSDFEVLGKITQPPEMGGGVQYVCLINGVKWWVPDDMANADRQKVEVWVDDGGTVKDLTPEEASSL